MSFSLRVSTIDLPLYCVYLPAGEVVVLGRGRIALRARESMDGSGPVAVRVCSCLHRPFVNSACCTVAQRSTCGTIG